MIKKLNFTIVELLVVISIIVILVSMLLPALNKARAKGHTAACKNNLKQFGTAFAIYENAYNDYLIPYENQKWGINVVKALPLSKGASDKFAAYSNKIFDCPGVVNSADGYGDYGYSDAISGNYANYPLLKITRIRKPSSIIAITDNNYYSKPKYAMIYAPSIWGASYYNASYGYYNNIGTHHNDGPNVLWLDGHVDGRKIKDVWGTYSKYWEPSKS